MKINLYYVVKEYQPGSDSVGRSSDAILISGPWPTEEQARSVVSQMTNPFEYTVLIDELKLKRA